MNKHEHVCCCMSIVDMLSIRKANMRKRVYQCPPYLWAIIIEQVAIYYRLHKNYNYYMSATVEGLMSFLCHAGLCVTLVQTSI